MVLYSVLFLILAALAPPLILLGIIYRLDQIEREPLACSGPSSCGGVLAMVPILVLEMLADQFIDFFYWRPMVYLFLAYFVVPGFIEEGIKYRVLRRRTWNEPNFNYRFDGVVYRGVRLPGLCRGGECDVCPHLRLFHGGGAGHLLHPRPRHVRGGDGGRPWARPSGWPPTGRASRRPPFSAGPGCLPAILHGAYDFLLVGFGWVFYLYFAGLVVYVLRLLAAEHSGGRSHRGDVMVAPAPRAGGAVDAVRTLQALPRSVVLSGTIVG